MKDEATTWVNPAKQRIALEVEMKPIWFNTNPVISNRNFSPCWISNTVKDNLSFISPSPIGSRWLKIPALNNVGLAPFFLTVQSVWLSTWT